MSVDGDSENASNISLSGYDADAAVVEANLSRVFAENNENMIRLKSLINKPANLRKSGSSDINVFIPNGKCYSLSGGIFTEFIRLMDCCRKDGVRMHFAEKQEPFSGIMIDLDIDHYSDQLQITDTHISLLCTQIYNTLISIVDDA